MSIYTLQYRDLIPGGVAAELDSLSAAISAVLSAEHDLDTGAHTDVTLDSLAARDGTTNIIPVTGALRFLKGGLLFDLEGNTSHVVCLRPPTITADQHNYNPTGLANALVIEVDLDADHNMTGLNRLARQKRLLILGNRTDFSLTLKHASASSETVNQFGLPGSVDLVLADGAYVLLYYDVGSEVWRVIQT